MVQCRRGHWRDALSSDNSTLAIKPDDAVALGNRGNVRHQLHPPHLSAAHHNSGEAADLIMWQARSVAMRVAKPADTRRPSSDPRRIGPRFPCRGAF